ncbi:MAG: hypothetical protein QME81_03700 [bacterium]|nr:hypothetical protein [bacterium]
MRQAIYGLIVVASIGMLIAGCAKQQVIKEVVKEKAVLEESEKEGWYPGRTKGLPLRGVELPAWIEAGSILPEMAKEMGLPERYVYFVNYVDADNITAAQIGAEALGAVDIAQSYEAVISGTKAYKLAEATGAGTAQYIKGLGKIAAKNVNVHGMTVRKRIPCELVKLLDYPNVEHIGYRIYALLQMSEEEYKRGLKRAIESETKMLRAGPISAEVQDKLDVMDKIDKEVDEKFSGE